MATVSQPASHPTPTHAPQRQRGAYAIVLDEVGRVLVVRADNGRSYLPGGRIEPGETAQRALVREIAEECGWSAAIGTALGSISQPIMNHQVQLDASYWRARLLAPLPGPAEHDMAWLTLSEAARRLHRPGDAAALKAALGE